MLKLKKNVVLITIDALRADHVGCLGYNRQTTPAIDVFSKMGALCSNAISNGSWTPSSFISLFTSTYPLMYGGYNHISESRVTISEILKKEGYVTMGFHSNPYLSKSFGYDRGFSIFEYFSISINNLESRIRKIFSHLTFLGPLLYFFKYFLNIYFSKPYTNAVQINKQVLSYLDQLHEPFFLWVHYMDAHDPFIPAKKYINELGFNSVSSWEMCKLNDKINTASKSKNKSQLLSKKEVQTIIDLYDAEIRSVDDAINLLLKELKNKISFDDTYFIITSDHGQEFGEHGGYLHSSDHKVKLFDELLRVPLIIVGPDIKSKIIENQLSLLDLAPTILDLLNIPLPKEFIGKSFLPLIKEFEHTSEMDVISEGRILSGEDAYSYRTIDQWKCILSRNKVLENIELYDLKNDPKELHNISSIEEKKVTELKRKLMNHILLIEKTSENIDAPPFMEDDELIKERLRKLGYL